MSDDTTDESTEDLGSQPHTWEQAAQAMAATQLEAPLRGWLRGSGLPGADNINDRDSWPLADRVQFLKLVCGEQA